MHMGIKGRQVHPLIRFLLRSRVDEKCADLHKSLHLLFCSWFTSWCSQRRPSQQRFPWVLQLKEQILIEQITDGRVFLRYRSVRVLLVVVISCSYGPGALRTIFPACCCHNECLQYGLGLYMQRAGSLGALVRTDNTAAISYINRFVSLQSRRMSQLKLPAWPPELPARGSQNGRCPESLLSLCPLTLPPERPPPFPLDVARARDAPLGKGE